MLDNNLSPVLIFTYKRLDTLKLTIEALKKNHLSELTILYVFSDAAKSEKDQHQVQSVRDYITTITGFKSITIFQSEKNKGLAKSIIEGVTKIFEFYDKVIVLEDDLITTSNFINFMNESLVHFQTTQKVFSISGYSFSLSNPKTDYPSDGYLINRGWSWGWATWKDRWENIDWEVRDYPLFKSNKMAQKEFALGGSDLNKMLREQMESDLDSWAIRWFYHQYKIKGLTFYPHFSKVFNAGFDEYATHTKGSDKRYRPLMDGSNKTLFNYPDEIKEDAKFQKKFQKKMSVKRRIWGKIETMFNKLF
jgi:hypothetical protein